MTFDASRLEPLDRGLLEVGTELGLAPHRNEVAPDAVLGARAPGEDLLIDPAYGLIYDQAFANTVGLYGRSTEIPQMPGDELANVGFLRVPFRRVPRRRLRSRAELDRIVAAIDGRGRVVNYWRGQAREYLLERSPETRNLLYGGGRVIEPSILTSAGREGLAWETILPVWAPIVCTHLDLRPELEEWRTALYGSYRLRALLLALAQHYSLPSAGLDVTSSLRVGLFFALHEFERDGDRVICRRKPPDGGDSVLYSLVAQPKVAIDYDALVPPPMTAARPRAQSARFLANAWHRAPNACARMLFCAFYLDPAIDWGDDVPGCDEMFPSGDEFAAWLDAVSQRDLEPTARDLLARHAPVVDGDG